MFEEYKPRKRSSMYLLKRGFTLNVATALNNLVYLPEWKGIDILCDKKNKLIAIREGITLTGKNRQNTKGEVMARTVPLKQLMAQFDLKPARYEFKEHKEGLDIYAPTGQ